MMKQLVATLFILFSSLYSHAEVQYHVRGELSSDGDVWVRLYSLAASLPIDNPLSVNGVFTLEGKLPLPEFCLVESSDEKFRRIVLIDGDSLLLSCDGVNLLQGSAINNKLIQLFLTMEQPTEKNVKEILEENKSNVIPVLLLPSVMGIVGEEYVREYIKEYTQFDSIGVMKELRQLLLPEADRKSVV